MTRKTEPPLYLDLPFGEALQRFAQAKPAEVAESVARAKQKKVVADTADDDPSKPKRSRRTGP